MFRSTSNRPFVPLVAGLLAGALLVGTGLLSAHDTDYTIPDASHCTWTSSGGADGFLPLIPGLSLHLSGEEEDEGEIVQIDSINTVTYDTEVVAGVRTRVYLEVESEDGELVEISRNFVAICRETGDVWYFGEDVDDYEDGEIVGHEGAWRAGVDGAQPGVLMLGNPLLGSRFFEEVAPGVALDIAEIVSLGDSVDVPLGTYTDTVGTLAGSALEQDPPGDAKWYARGLGNIVDEDLELVEITLPECMPGATTHCLSGGRFEVEVEWEDFKENVGEGHAILPTDTAGEFWFFGPENTEVLVKVIDACETFDRFWVFAAGLTNVEVSLTVTDVATDQEFTVMSPLGQDFVPVLDTDAFMTCDAEWELDLDLGDDDDDE